MKLEAFMILAVHGTFACNEKLCRFQNATQF
jgi:hypothetical protein